MTPHPTPWTMETVTAGLCGFYREIAGVGLMFPFAARPIAVEYPGYPVITLRPIEGLEFVEDRVRVRRQKLTRAQNMPLRAGPLHFGWWRRRHPIYQELAT